MRVCPGSLCGRVASPVWAIFRFVLGQLYHIFSGWSKVPAPIVNEIQGQSKTSERGGEVVPVLLGGIESHSDEWQEHRKKRAVLVYALPASVSEHPFAGVAHTGIEPVFPV